MVVLVAVIMLMFVIVIMFVIVVVMMIVVVVVLKRLSFLIIALHVYHNVNLICPDSVFYGTSENNVIAVHV